jgi:hypothetical protein
MEQNWDPEPLKQAAIDAVINYEAEIKLIES